MIEEPKSQGFLEGDRLYLREVRLSDVNENYYRWMNDDDIIRYLESRYTPNSVEALRDFVTKLSGDGDSVFLAIVLKEGDIHIGNAKLGPINWVHRHANIGIIIGEKRLWGMGYASEAIKLVAAFAFNTLNLNKVMAGCYASNEGSARAFEKAGFTREGLRRNHYYQDGHYVDEILLGLAR